MNYGYAILESEIRNAINSVRLDYSNGERYSDSADTVPYWKPLSQTLDDYANHKETKSGGDVGLLPRLRMKIDWNLIKYVGKEVTNLDASNILGVTEGLLIVALSMTT